MAYNSSQGTKHHITINNPQEHGMTHEEIIKRIMMCNPKCYCMADEVGENGTYHTHFYIETNSNIRFSTLKNRFKTSHIERAKGTAAQNRDYIRKEGKWADDRKAETSVEGTYEEWGIIAEDESSKAACVEQLIALITEGKSNADIIEILPAYAMRLRAIDDMRAAIREKAYAGKMRTLNVVYISGATGTGKTFGIYEKHGAENVYRVTNYRKGKGIYFDSYNEQEVLVFEEFSGQIEIEDMLNYLDRYPIKLPARYNDKHAAYTMVYITSNLPIASQYQYAQYHRPETWKAFLRRINRIVEYRKTDGDVEIIDRGSGLDAIE